MHKSKNILLILVFLSSAYASQLEWLPFDEAYTKAKTENKIMLIDFYTDWCGWCKKMDRDTYSNDAIIEQMNKNFVAVKINPEKEGYIETEKGKMPWSRLASAVGVKGYPATAFFTSEFELIELVSGYFDPDEMKNLLTFMSDGLYDQLSFQDYRLFSKIKEISLEDDRPELDYILGYFYLNVFSETDKAYEKFKSALDKNLANKEVYAALHLSTDTSVEESNKWLSKAEELGYTDKSELEALTIRYLRMMLAAE